MKKLNKAIPVVVATALGLGMVCCTGSPQKTIQNNTIHAIIDSIVEKEVEPTGADIYIDASASMKGYFISEKPDFSGQLANLVGMYPNKKVFFVGKDTPYEGMVTKLISDLRSQPSENVSNFDVLLANMRHKVEEHPDKVTLLVTDAIMSVGKTTPKALQELGYSVRDSLRGFNGAIAILQFESEFLSDMKYQPKRVCYYTRDDSSKNVTIRNRPYYVIAVGSKDNIRSLKKNRLGAKQEIYFGIHDLASHKTNSQAEDSTSVLADVNAPVVLNATLPECIRILGKEYIEKNTEVYMNGELVPIKAYGNKVIDVDGSLNITISQDALTGQPLVADPATGHVGFTVKVRNELPQSWINLNSDDDRNIDIDSEQQVRTYGLLILLKGIKEALDANDYLLEIHFEFSN